MESGLVLGSYRPVAFDIDASVDRVWCVDSETTGLEAHIGHRIITLGAVELFLKNPPSTALGREIEWKCNPERSSDPEALKVHGISDAEAATFPLFADQADDFLETIKDTPLVIFNAAFDMGFINAELQRAGRPSVTNKIHDALEYARAGLPHRSSAKLDDMMRHFAIEEDRDTHGALKDAKILAAVFLRMYQASIATTNNYDDQMHPFTRLVENGFQIPMRADRLLKAPTSAEQAAHQQFMSKFMPKSP
jgi:DNA polymerase-3 subunit epsilon